MAKEILFKNKSSHPVYVEIKGNTNLTGKNPEVFDNDFDGHAQLVLVDVYGSIFTAPDIADCKPISYFRHVDIANKCYRFGNILELGDKPLDVQKGPVFPGKLAKKGDPVSDYIKISEEPLVYGFGSEDPFVECRFKKDGLYMKEADVFSLKCEPWPITIYDHDSFYVNSSCIFQPSTFSGLIDGKQFMGLGSYDRFHMHKNAGSFSDVPLGYTTSYMLGIREDGRKEVMFISGSFNEDGKTIALYWLEGETPIVTDYFTLEADWQHLPYVDDGTCVFKDAVIRFGGKEFHFEGKWGTKGFLDKPRLEKHGQSQMNGSWYEGKVPYKHRIFTGGFENMEAYDYKLKEKGFNVID